MDITSIAAIVGGLGGGLLMPRTSYPTCRSLLPRFRNRPACGKRWSGASTADTTTPGSATTANELSE